MTKLVFKTTAKINKGYESWDGKGNCPQDWRTKSGQEIIVNIPIAINLLKVSDIKPIIDELTDLLTEDNDYCFEKVLLWDTKNDDYESQYVKNQREYDDGFQVLYLDAEAYKASSGAWYMKKGFIVGVANKGTQHDHLVGKFEGFTYRLSDMEAMYHHHNGKTEYLGKVA